MWTDSSGAVRSGTIDGELKELGRAAVGNVTYGNVDGAGGDGILYTSGDSLVFESAATTSWARSIGCTLDGAARIVTIAKGHSGIAVACAGDERLWIMDASGMALPGMPLAGGKYYAVGDINKDGSVEVVTGNANGAFSAIVLGTPAP